MRTRGWFIQPQPAVGDLPRTAHLTVQAVNRANSTEFLDALRESAAEAADMPWAQPDAGLVEVAGQLEVDALDLPTVINLLAFAGLDVSEGPSWPQESAGIQALLESLPVAVRDKLLAGFFSAIFTANR